MGPYGVSTFYAFLSVMYLTACCDRVHLHNTSLVARWVSVINSYQNVTYIR